MFTGTPNNPAEGEVPDAVIRVETDPLNANNSYGAVDKETPSTLQIGDDGRPEFVTESSRFKDVAFSVLFAMHLVAMVVLGGVFGRYGTLAAQGFVATYIPRILLLQVLPAAVLTFGGSVLLVAVLIPVYTRNSVILSLVGTIIWIMLLTLGVCAITRSAIILAISLAMILMLAQYIRQVWRVIPFATSNILVALRIVNRNRAIYLLGVAFSVLRVTWILFWIYVVMGVLSYESGAYIQQPKQIRLNDLRNALLRPLQVITLLLLSISLYWTSRVIKNTTQVAVAGVTMAWCFDKHESHSFCSAVLTQSLLRGSTVSFGSVCLGSLTSGFVSICRGFVRFGENQKERMMRYFGCCSMACCCLPECIGGLFGDSIDYFNQWNYACIGVYGLSYLDSGCKAKELFDFRGWSNIVSNSLTDHVMDFMSFTVGIMGAIVAVLIDVSILPDHDTASYCFGNASGSLYWSLGIGFVSGVSMGSILMGSVVGAVRTLYICFADQPAQIEDNHPGDAQLMAQAWSRVYPQSGVSPQPQYSTSV